MKKASIIGLAISIHSICFSQLKEVLYSSENKKMNIHYVDSANKHYTTGKIADLNMQIVFTKVLFDAEHNSFLIEGRTIIPLYNNDTLGFSGISIFLAETKKDTLFNIRNLGISNSSELNPVSNDGFFSYKVKLKRRDKLFFAALNGQG